MADKQRSTRLKQPKDTKSLPIVSVCDCPECLMCPPEDYVG